MGKIYSARDMLEKLVSFRTVSRDSNLELVDWVKDYLEGHGLSVHLDFDQDQRKASLFTEIGPAVPGGIVLSGHTDVVPVDGQMWDTDPWQVTEKDGRLFGRGTCDMKGFDAIVLALVPRMVEADLARPIQIALSRDEELGCIGAPPMIRAMQSVFPPASVTIVGEPTMMRVVTAHKGGTGLWVRVRGHEVHSSMIHKGVSAVMTASRLIDWANQRNKENSTGQPTGIARQFDPPYTTLHVGTVKGGTASNITAKNCEFGLEFRCIPDQDPEEWKSRFIEFAGSITEEVQGISKEAGIKVLPWYDVPPLAPEEGGAAETIARQLTGDNGTNVVSYGTEAGQFQETGHSVVVCGPGSIKQAHQPNEFMTKGQLEAGEKFIKDLIEICAN